MILYHGSNVEIEAIDFSKSKPGKDFGVGFYLSADENQALEMAEKDAMLSEKDARIAALEALVNQYHDGEPLITIKKLEHQNEDLRRTTYGQKTEGKYNGRNDMTPADEADLNLWECEVGQALCQAGVPDPECQEL